MNERVRVCVQWKRKRDSKKADEEKEEKLMQKRGKKCHMHKGCEDPAEEFFSGMHRGNKKNDMSRRTAENKHKRKSQHMRERERDGGLPQQQGHALD